MVVPLALALATVPPMADLARGEAEFLRGNAHCDAREFSDALASYDRAAAFGYEDHVMWNNRGVARNGQLLEELNKFDEAVDAYNAATSQNPEDGDAWTGLGDALYALERYEEAVEAYDRAIAADPNNEEAWNNKGFTFFMLGIHEEALACYEKALAINPRYKQAWYNKGYTFHGINRLEEAVTAYEKAIEMDRGDEVLWNNLGNALYNLGRYEQSIPYFERALEVNPRYEIAWNNIGNALNKMGRHEPSLKYHDKSLEIKPDFDYALYAKGHALDSLGRHEEGLELISQSLELNPNYDHAWMAKAEALHHLGRLEEARDALNNTLILNGSLDEAWVFRGKILEEMGNALEAERCYEEALQCFQASLEIEPDNAELRYHQAVLLEDLERVDEAIDGYAASASKAHGADALLRLSALLLRVGRPGDAIVPAEELRSRDPADSRGWLAAGRALLAAGPATDSGAAPRKAADLRAARARPGPARTLRVLGRADDALAALDGIEAPSGETLLLRAEIHAGLGRIEDAVADCSAAIRATAIGRDLVYRRKGELLLRLNRPKEAVAAFDAAIGLNPTDSETWCDAARAWRALGQETRARKMVDQALRLDPTSSQALNLRSEGAASS